MNIALLLALIPLFAFAGYKMMHDKGREGWVGAMIAGLAACVSPFIAILSLVILLFVPKKKQIYPDEPTFTTLPPEPGKPFPAPPQPVVATQPYVPPQSPSPPGA